MGSASSSTRGDRPPSPDAYRGVSQVLKPSALSSPRAQVRASASLLCSPALKHECSQSSSTPMNDRAEWCSASTSNGLSGASPATEAGPPTPRGSATHSHGAATAFTTTSGLYYSHRTAAGSAVIYRRLPTQESAGHMPGHGGGGVSPTAVLGSSSTSPRSARSPPPHQLAPLQLHAVGISKEEILHTCRSDFTPDDTPRGRDAVVLTPVNNIDDGPGTAACQRPDSTRRMRRLSPIRSDSLAYTLGSGAVVRNDDSDEDYNDMRTYHDGDDDEEDEEDSLSDLEFMADALTLGCSVTSSAAFVRQARRQSRLNDAAFQRPYRTETGKRVGIGFNTGTGGNLTPPRGRLAMSLDSETAQERWERRPASDPSMVVRRGCVSAESRGAGRGALCPYTARDGGGGFGGGFAGHVNARRPLPMSDHDGVGAAVNPAPPFGPSLSGRRNTPPQGGSPFASYTRTSLTTPPTREPSPASRGLSSRRSSSSVQFASVVDGPPRAGKPHRLAPLAPREPTPPPQGSGGNSPARRGIQQSLQVPQHLAEGPEGGAANQSASMQFSISSSFEDAVSQGAGSHRPTGGDERYSNSQASDRYDVSGAGSPPAVSCDRSGSAATQRSGTNLRTTFESMPHASPSPRYGQSEGSSQDPSCHDSSRTVSPGYPVLADTSPARRLKHELSDPTPLGRAALVPGADDAVNQQDEHNELD